ncbi:MAG: S8 family serine peptidase [Candidatus Sumerlaeaceae bacterium]|nr:S8 family serine peptidase [Candidatus Sumerlaeaceae bacterium]
MSLVFPSRWRMAAIMATILTTLIAPTQAAKAYRSPGSSHKVKVQAGGASDKALSAASASLIADYGSYKVYSASDPDALFGLGNALVELHDDYNVIELNARRIDTTTPDAIAMRTALAQFTGRKLHLVQFAAPVKSEWLDELKKAGCDIVTYIPNNAYLVYADRTALTQVQALAKSNALIQWEGDYTGDLKISPLRAQGKAKSDSDELPEDLYAVQMVNDPAGNIGTLQLIETMRSQVPLKDERVLNYRNIIVRLSGTAARHVAGRPDVVSVASYIVPEKNCERQDQIISGNLTSLNQPSGAGYLAWLGTKGFNQAQFTTSNFAVDVTDSGIDNGSTSPNHFGLYLGGVLPGTSRVIYNRLEGTPNTGSTTQGCDGHGTLNSHIIAGYNNLSGFPHADSAGYRYGLGVAPFVKVGSSVIFDPSNYTFPDFENLISKAYNDGARISSNSWGSNTAGGYNTDSQAYDALVRDAQPTGATFAVAGNQEMTIVFAAGNAGAGAQTVGSPGTGKNVICVGASENVQAFGGADACGTGDDEADSADDIIGFSSRGPCSDGRVKPDIVAPGTHVSGGVAQQAVPGANGLALACFNAEGVCAGPSASNFFPLGQQFYSASSGTSHSTPATAGACALVRQYFINQMLGIPSPAMTKAFLMNSARYMTGLYANDNLYSNNQGMGMVNMGTAFDGTARIIRDQVGGDIFTGAGQQRVFNVKVSDVSKPVRVTLAWTDAPGATSGNAYNNNLDLEVIGNGSLYRGNVFSGPFSMAGGSSDAKNNVESVFLPPGTSGTLIIRVNSTAVASDGVPNSGGATDQDFALVGYNLVSAPGSAQIIYTGATLVSESCAPPNAAIDPNETVGLDVTLNNFGGLSSVGTVTAKLLPSANVVPVNGSVSYGTLASAASATRNHTFIANGKAGTKAYATLEIQDNGVPIGTVSIPFDICKPTAGATFSYTGPAVNIPDGNTAGVNTTVTVSGANPMISKLVFRVDGSSCSNASGDPNAGISHTYVGDLIVKLTSPKGTVVTIMNRPGTGSFGSSGNNFCQTVLDDTGANSIQSIVSGGAPYTGTFAPANPLSAFIGENPNGIWTLNISDNFSSDIGVVRAYSLLISGFDCCGTMATVSQADSFTTNVEAATANDPGWSYANQGIAGTTHDATGGALRIGVPTRPDASSYSATYWITNLSEWLPYAYVGTGNIVRSKNYVYASGQVPNLINSIPNLRLKLQNASAVASVFELLPTNNNAVEDKRGEELAPSRDSGKPSIYRVDYDPVDVPYLASNAQKNGFGGIARSFENYSFFPQMNGNIFLAESSIFVYPASLIADGAALSDQPFRSKNYGPTDLADFDGTTKLQRISGGGAGSFGTVLTTPPLPSATFDGSGATMSSVGFPTTDLGVVELSFSPVAKAGANWTASDYASVPRVEEFKQYKIRFHTVSSRASNLQSQIRFRARTDRFLWAQKLEIGGAYPTNNAINIAIAAQTLPGVGCLNPDTGTLPGGTGGGWYTVILHTPLSQEIRPEINGPIQQKMPYLSVQPGPGDATIGNTRRMIFTGADLLDTLSQGSNASAEAGLFTIDAIQIKSYSLVPD